MELNKWVQDEDEEKLYRYTLATAFDKNLYWRVTMDAVSGWVVVELVNGTGCPISCIIRGYGARDELHLKDQQAAALRYASTVMEGQGAATQKALVQAAEKTETSGLNMYGCDENRMIAPANKNRGVQITNSEIERWYHEVKNKLFTNSDQDWTFVRSGNSMVLGIHADGGIDIYHLQVLHHVLLNEPED